MFLWRLVTSVEAPTSSLVIEISRRNVVSTVPVAEIVTTSSVVVTGIVADWPGGLVGVEKGLGLGLDLRFVEIDRSSDGQRRGIDGAANALLGRESS